MASIEVGGVLCLILHWNNFRLHCFCRNKQRPLRSHGDSLPPLSFVGFLKRPQVLTFWGSRNNVRLDIDCVPQKQSFGKADANVLDYTGTVQDQWTFTLDAAKNANSTESWDL